jgi:hypothetical protein
MQDVGENMDELFRKAAEQYMLKEGESNWNEISGQLQSPVAPVTPVSKNHKNHTTRKYIVTGILLLICIITGMVFYHYPEKEDALPINAKQQTNATDHNKANEESLPLKDKTFLQGKAVPGEDTKETTSALNNNSNINKRTSKALSENYSTYKSGSNKYLAFDDLSTVSIAKSKIDYTSVQDLQTALNKQPFASDKQDLNQNHAEKKPVVKLNTKNKHGMYYGLLAGAGFTTVKSQSFTRPGFDAGFVAGYQLTQRSSVEIDLLFSHKYYYTDGQHFKTDKMGDMPADMKLMSVKGNSSIFEIPVKFKYNVLQKRTSTIYATAGVSSYILVNEKNDYVTSTNGTMGNMNGNYTTATGYFAGALNISAGYAHTIGKNSSIRFEPYITIPTKGIGIGSLPVTTSGVHILFTLAPSK